MRLDWSCCADSVPHCAVLHSREPLAPLCVDQNYCNCNCTALQEVKEKKRWGRLQKSKGDWSLLVGSPKDAFEHYKSAMELSRAAGDAIW
jgi:predicted negative regulator of RcsB-dependent stress response